MTSSLGQPSSTRIKGELLQSHRRVLQRCNVFTRGKFLIFLVLLMICHWQPLFIFTQPNTVSQCDTVVLGWVKIKTVSHQLFYIATTSSIQFRATNATNKNKHNNYHQRAQISLYNLNCRASRQEGVGCIQPVLSTSPLATSVASTFSLECIWRSH